MVTEQEELRSARALGSFSSFLPALHSQRSWCCLQPSSLPTPHPTGRENQFSFLAAPQFSPVPGWGQQLTFPTSSGPGWRVMEQGRLVAIWTEQGKKEKRE